MAARLIQRSWRLLAAPIPVQPLSFSLPSECVRPCRLALSLPVPRAALHTSLPCHSHADSHADSLPDPSPVLTTSPVQSFHASLMTIDSVDGLLNVYSEQQTTPNMITAILQEISRREIPNKQELLQDNRFQVLLKTVNGKITYVWSGRLVKLLKSLYTLGLDRQDRYVQSVETEIQWRLRKFSMGNLVQLATLFVPPVYSKEKWPLLDNLMKQVELRWTEINDTRTLMILICRLGCMSTSLMEKLEDKVLEFAELFTLAESRKIVMLLSAQNLRSRSVLRALSFHLTQEKNLLPPPVIIDVAFAFAKLNFFQSPVLHKMAADFMLMIPKLKSMDIASFTRSMAALRFSNLPLYEAIAKVCIDASDSFTTSQLCVIVNSLALLNFQPNDSEVFFSMIHKRLSSDLDMLTLPTVLDVVWSLCVVGQATVPYFQRVLVPEFYSYFLDESTPRFFRHCLKLLHINATARLEIADYQGPLLPDHVLERLLLKTKNTTLSTLQSSVINQLKTIFPEPDTCSFNVPTVYGWCLDGEVVLDPENKALMMTGLVSPHTLMSKGTMPLPKGARRFAILTRGFSNYFNHTKDLMGQHVMKRRHLQAAGFLVVEVPFYGWQELQSEWQKNSYLNDQIRKAVAEEMEL